MLPVEVVATMVPSRLPWYRRMQETAWAIIEEAFSEKVIVPGKTTALVSSHAGISLHAYTSTILSRNLLRTELI